MRWLPIRIESCYNSCGVYSDTCAWYGRPPWSSYRSIFRWDLAVGARPSQQQQGGIALQPQLPHDVEAFADVITDAVVSLRRQRHPWMVEGPGQFVFLHQVIFQECLAACDAMEEQ